MALRIFYGFLALVAVYAAIQVYMLSTARGALFNVPAEYTFGPQDADLKVVEFLNYSCPFCREIHPTIMEAVKKDGRVLYIPRPLPSEDPESVTRTLLVYGAAKQGKFIEMHSALIENYRVISDDVLSDITDRLGLDIQQLKEDSEAAENAKMPIMNGKVYYRLGGRATPTFMIGKNIFYVPTERMPTVDDFLNMFAEARNSK